MTRDDRRLLSVVLGVPSLAAHGVLALVAAGAFLGLPLEAGGLFFGPVLGFPLGAFGLAALLAAALMPWRPTQSPVPGCLGAALLFDGFALMTGAQAGWALLGLVASGGSLVLLATTVDLRLRGTSGF